MNKQIKLYIFNQSLIKLLNKFFININFNESEKIELTVNVVNLELQENKECVFDILGPILFNQESSEKRINIEDCDSEILSIIDDLIFDEVQSNLWTYFNTELRRANDFYFEDLSNQIKNASSLETLYFKIRTDKITYPSYIKDYILYKLLMENNLEIKDISIVEDFIDNFYQIKYADLIIKYPTLGMEYKNKFLNNKNINPVILEEYLNQIDSLPDFNQVLSSENLQEISSYYFKMWNNILFDDQSYVVNKLLNYEKTPQHILYDIYNRYDIIFIYQHLLIHPNCPKNILLNYINVPTYIPYIVKNILLDDSLVEKIIYSPIENNIMISVYNTILENQNISEELKKVVSQKVTFINSFNNDDFIKSNSASYWQDLISGKIFNNPNISISEKLYALSKINKVIKNEEINSAIESIEVEIKQLIEKNSPDKKSIEHDYITEILQNDNTDINKTPIIDNLINNKQLYLIPDSHDIKEQTIQIIKEKINNNYTLAIDLAEYLLSDSMTNLWGMKINLSNQNKKELISLLNKSEIPQELKQEINKLAS